MSGVQHCSALSWISSSQVSLCRWGRLAFMFSDLPEWGSCVYRSSWSSLLLCISWESFRNPWENSRSFELFSVHWQTNRTAFLAHDGACQKEVCNSGRCNEPHLRKWELCAHLVTDIMATPTSGSHYKTGDDLRFLSSLVGAGMWPLALIGWEAGDLIRPQLQVAFPKKPFKFITFVNSHAWGRLVGWNRDT